MDFLKKITEKKSDAKTPQGVDEKYSSIGWNKNQENYTSVTLPPQKSIHDTIGGGQNKSGKAHVKGRPGGGWEDDEETNNTGFDLRGGARTGARQPEEVKQETTRRAAAPTLAAPPQETQVFSADELESKNYDYEKRLVFDIVQPGGARIKPPENLIQEFCKAAENLQVPLIGSLLLSKLTLDVVWVMKAKVLYAIEALCRSDKYYRYFKQNIWYVKNTTVSADGATQLQNLLATVTKLIENPDSIVEDKQSDYEFKPINIPAPQKTAQPNGNQGTSLLDMDGPANAPAKGGFSFIKKTSEAQSPAEIQPASKPQNSSNAFGFIKASQPQAHPEAAKPTSSLLNLDFNLGQPTQSNPVQQQASPNQGASLLNLYGNQPGGAQPVKKYSNDLMSMHLGTSGMPPPQQQYPYMGPATVQVGHPVGQPIGHPGYAMGQPTGYGMGQPIGQPMGHAPAPGYGFSPQLGYQQNPVQMMSHQVSNMTLVDPINLSAGNNAGEKKQSKDERESAFDFLQF